MRTPPAVHAPRVATLTAFAALLLLPATASFAQQVTTKSPAPPPSPEEETVQLSPFVVNSNEDKGYRATSTLAGTRIKTNLRDVAASITEVTTEFLHDVSATDINDVLVYMANTESTRNFTDAPQAGIGGFDDRTSSNPNTANRVRGLNAATLTRDYFITIGNNVGFDSYNVDRITINRGPNSILFGLGDPSGIVNYAPKLARLDKNANEVSLRYGSNDDLRGTLDFNRVLLKNQLAVRIDALWSERGYEQKPSVYRDNRFYATVTYTPFKQTTLRASYEYARQKQQTPNSITPIDHVTSWIAAGRPAWDPTTQNWNNNRPSYFASTAGGGTVGSTRPDGSLENTFVEGVGNTYWATFWQPSPAGVYVFNSLGVSNDRYVDLHGTNLRSTTNKNDLSTFTASWDQQLLTGLYLNVSYLREDLDSRGLGGFRANQFGIYVDVNRKLPNGTTNPHFGETFIPERSLDSKNISDTQNESLRGTLAYTLDFTKRQGLLHWIGKHNFTGYAEDRTVSWGSNTFNGTRVESPSYLDPKDKINAGDWQITYLRYLGGTADAPAKFGVTPVQRGAVGVPHTYWNPTTAAWAQDQWSDFFALKRRDIGENSVGSSAFVWQADLLDNRIVGTAGWRRDRNRVAQRSYTDRNPLTGVVDYVDGTLPTPTILSGDTKSYGVVVHPVKWVSLHYNRSENFQARAGDVDVFGHSIGPPQGKGKDYGVSLDLFDGKLNAKVNWYEVESTNARMPFNGPVVEVQWELPWFDQVVIPGLAKKYGLTWGPSDQFTPLTYGDSRIAETSDQLSKGVEIELIYNPTPNWRIMANVSKQKAVQTNLAPGLTSWIATVLPKWQKQPWFAGAQTFDAGWGVDGNLQTYFNSFNTGRNLATYKAFEGQSDPQLRTWHANVISNYTFTETPLKGWNIGGAVRWESEAAIGYPAVTAPVNGVTSLVGLDLAHAYTDGGNYNVDGWLGYTRRIWRDKINWNIQLNVRDINRHNGLQPIVKNSDGTPAVFRIEFGPTWYLTSTFSF